MAANLSKEVVNTTISAVTSGAIFATKEVELQRFELCKNCEHFTHEENRCKICGCFMQSKVKLIAAKCPAGKW